ncbi:MAG TPA: tRNA (adenosine(37)-N6)-threonylcarbamoyltransferase complex ATPase subunit type 1 TsaE, partial [Enterovirga sp.]|nr:tRNA (adenosine(37)-N6)-threonylcarbamoyltransferase complex ATPase subunit type 1 TsaE [Enterovirga sp.]
MSERDALPRSSGAGDSVAQWTLPLPHVGITESLGQFLAQELQPGDLVTLSGGLGAGKTTLARAIVRALANDPDLEVPSPTFTLLQSYETEAGPVVHADFYRISGPGELRELGWEEMTEQSIVLVEWPERAEAALARSRLDIILDLAPGQGAEARTATFIARGATAERFARARALQELLHTSGWADGAREPMQGDASTRAYERLLKPTGETAILMISPPRADGPPVRRGKPYSAIARLAESIHAFVAMDRALRALGFSAPRIYGEDLDAGLLILEDLGKEPVVSRDGPIPERYGEATRLLARLHGARLPNVLPVADGYDHVLPPYDLDALMIEVELLLDWYAPHVANQNFSGSVRGEFA